MKYAPGTLVLIPFPFTNLESNKIRPALVISSYQEDVVLLFITSHHKKMFFEHSLKVDPSRENGLKIESQIIISKIATLDRKMILGVLGTLEAGHFKKVQEKLGRFLGV
jgi:mRNA interferase MazF